MKRGFTLIELLIVMGILAVLATVVVLVLNPAQILAQARDAQRISDLASVRSAIALYLSTTTSTPNVGAGPYGTFGITTSTCGFGTCNGLSDATRTKVDGTGWVRINFTETLGGAPLAALPVDPTNNATYQYAYNGNVASKTFELNGRLESDKHKDLMKNDGGDDSTCVTYTEEACYYEIGTAPGLAL